MATAAGTISPVRSRRRNTKKLTRRVVSHVVLIVLSVVFVIPFLWLLSTSFKIDTQIFRFPPVWIPSPVTFNQYYLAVTTIPFFVYLRNSVIYCVGSRSEEHTS